MRHGVHSAVDNVHMCTIATNTSLPVQSINAIGDETSGRYACSYPLQSTFSWHLNKHALMNSGVRAYIQSTMLTFVGQVHLQTHQASPKCSCAVVMKEMMRKKRPWNSQQFQVKAAPSQVPHSLQSLPASAPLCAPRKQ